MRAGIFDGLSPLGRPFLEGVDVVDFAITLRELMFGSDARLLDLVVACRSCVSELISSQ